MKKLLTAVILVSLSLNLGLGAFAEDAQQWKCKWTGSYGVQGQVMREDYNMEGFMFAADGGLVIRANSTESAGTAKIRAGCDAKECWVEQKFDEDDSMAYFSLKTQIVVLKSSKIYAYKGTWGLEEDPKTHKGPIEFSGTCTPLNLADSEDFDDVMKESLGWDVENF